MNEKLQIKQSPCPQSVVGSTKPPIVDPDSRFEIGRKHFLLNLLYYLTKLRVTHAYLLSRFDAQTRLPFKMALGRCNLSILVASCYCMDVREILIPTGIPLCVLIS